MNVLVRDGRASDMAYVLDSWVLQGVKALGYRDWQLALRRMPQLPTSDLMWQRAGGSALALKGKYAAILVRCRVTVACLPDDQDAIIGFLVSEGPQCHMLYVRSSARRLGVANAICRKVWQ